MPKLLELVHVLPLQTGNEDYNNVPKLPSHICLILSLYKLISFSSTYVRRKFLNLVLISALGAAMETHSRTV